MSRKAQNFSYIIPTFLIATLQTFSNVQNAIFHVIFVSTSRLIVQPIKLDFVIIRGRRHTIMNNVILNSLLFTQKFELVWLILLFRYDRSSVDRSALKKWKRKNFISKIHTSEREEIFVGRKDEIPKRSEGYPSRVEGETAAVGGETRGSQLAARSFVQLPRSLGPRSAPVRKSALYAGGSIGIRISALPIVLISRHESEKSLSDFYFWISDRRSRKGRKKSNFRYHNQNSSLLHDT